MKKLIYLLFVMALAASFVACEKDDDNDNNNNNNNNNNNDPKTGSVEIVVKLNTTTGPHLGWADVKLYLSKDDREKGVAAFDSNVTDGNNYPHVAKFYNLPIDYYYIKAWYEAQGKKYEGEDEIQIVKGDTLSFFMAVTEQ